MAPKMSPIRSSKSASIRRCSIRSAGYTGCAGIGILWFPVIARVNNTIAVCTSCNLRTIALCPRNSGRSSSSASSSSFFSNSSSSRSSLRIAAHVSDPAVLATLSA